MAKVDLNARARASSSIYADALLEACAQCKVADPLRALLDTDAYPRLMKIPTVEFAIGWLHGCAETHGITVEQLWDLLQKARAA